MAAMLFVDPDSDVIIRYARRACPWAPRTAKFNRVLSKKPQYQLDSAPRGCFCSGRATCGVCVGIPILFLRGSACLMAAVAKQRDAFFIDRQLYGGVDDLISGRAKAWAPRSKLRDRRRTELEDTNPRPVTGTSRCAVRAAFVWQRLVITPAPSRRG